MCGITGFCNYNQDFFSEKERWLEILEDMKVSLKKRGPDESGEYLDSNCALGHARLAIIDLKTGKQPITKKDSGRTFSIVYNGELYNMKELREELINEGCSFDTNSDTEIILNGFMKHGVEFVHKLNGIFAFAVWDSENLYLVRDRAGIKPLFYSIIDGCFVFGSELKALLAYPGIEPIIDKDGLCEIFAIGPARTPGGGVFKNISEFPPGHFGVFTKAGLFVNKYWDVESKVHTDSYEETIEKTAFLVKDAIKRQMVSDVPICSLLSGGLDSSIVTSVVAAELKEKGEVLSTFSFDFEGNDEHFKANSFQPERDRLWVDKMVDYCKTNHSYLTCTTRDMFDALYEAVDAKDLPGMADVDSSLLYFCKKVREHNKVALTGECADEVFGGYPWFHSKEAFETEAFPWSRDLSPRKTILSDEMLKMLDIDDYSKQRYMETILKVPKLMGESKEESRRREIAYLNLKWFMTTLIDRMDRVSMYSGLEARVPFADHRIIEYVFNIPWDMKCKDGVVKNLLREAGRGLLPDEVLFRKKSPFPKSYNPVYEQLLSERLNEIISDGTSPVLDIIDKEKLKSFIASPKDYGKPWFGQLMAGPQMLAYIIQIEYWMNKYKVKIEI